MEKQKLLIVDDEEINRAILSEIFKDDYKILEADNGQDAARLIDANKDLVLVLLDVVMPKLDGFGVLDYMREQGLLEHLPVILITSQKVDESDDRAYSYGVADVMHKPFYPEIVRRRSRNIIELYQSKRNMEIKLEEQKEKILAQEKELLENNDYMIETLSTVVEFRDLETGDHVRRIKYFTRIMLKYLAKYFPKYDMVPERIDSIARASALHDIGKIGIPDAILLKPGRLTSEEYEIMKTHTTIGCEILEKFRRNEVDEFYQHCYDICRYHHERWDGRGYPDNLAGDAIPISAQVVAVADVYDALVSKRVNKEAFATTKAHEMIMKGECGQFSPDVLECFELAKEDFFNIIEVIKMFDFT